MKKLSKQKTAKLQKTRIPNVKVWNTWKEPLTRKLKEMRKIVENALNVDISSKAIILKIRNT